MVSQEAAAGTETVTFDLDFYYVRATFTPSITVPDGTVAPDGGSKTASVSANTGMLTISLTVPGVGTTSMNINPLGSNEYTVPGLTYDYGFVDFGIWLQVGGYLQGDLSAQGSGTVGPSSIDWDSSGARSMTVTSNTGSAEGETITVTLHDISYSLWIGLEARGSFLGEQMEITILDYMELGSLTGSPSFVSGTFQIQKESVFGALGAILPWLLVIIIIVVVAVIALVALKARKKKQMAMGEMAQEPVALQGQPPQQVPVTQSPAQQRQPTMEQLPRETPQYSPPPAQEPAPIPQQGPSSSAPPVQQPYPVVPPTQQYAPQQGYRCQVCAQPLTFVPQYQRWFCNNCQRYL